MPQQVTSQGLYTSLEWKNTKEPLPKRFNTKMDCRKANLHQLNRPWLRPRNTPRSNQCTIRPEPVGGTRYLETAQSDPKWTRLLECSNTASTSPNDQCRRATLQRLTLQSSTSHGIPIQHWPRTPAEGPCPGKCR